MDQLELYEHFPEEYSFLTLFQNLSTLWLLSIQVASFTGEKQAVAKYNESLTKAYKSGVHEGLAAGLGFGAFTFVAFSSYSLAIWFGGKMILEKGYKGGDVINVIFCVMIGSM